MKHSDIPYHLQNYPSAPGVYLMQNEEKKILYIGKSKNLRQRIQQYLKGQDSRAQIAFLMRQVTKIETIIVSSEREALLLEHTLIQKHQPKYNVLKKGHSSQIGIALNPHTSWPRPYIVYSLEGRGDCYGPYVSLQAARDILTRLEDFQLRTCSDTEFKRRTRPCLRQGMGLCCAPCVGWVTKEEYDQRVQAALQCLRGNDQILVETLRQEMEKASHNLEFERAQRLLKKIEAIEMMQTPQKVSIHHKETHMSHEESMEVIGAFVRKGQGAIAILSYRKGVLLHAEKHLIQPCIYSEGELVESFLLSHPPLIKQSGQHLPRHFCLLPPTPSSLSSLKEALTTLSRHKIPSLRRAKGLGKHILQMARMNAKAELDKVGLPHQLQQLLGLPCPPLRIGCVDVSHLQGTQMTFSFVLFERGILRKKWTVSYDHISNEFDCFRAGTEEVLRTTNLLDKTNLLVVDGGAAHLNLMYDTFHSLLSKEGNKNRQQGNIDGGDGVLDNVPHIIALSKEDGRHDKGNTQETIHYVKTRSPQCSKTRGCRNDHQKQSVKRRVILPLLLPLHDPLLFLLQEIRDAAHDAAIQSHRAQRKPTSLLEGCPGIGPKKAQKILDAFPNIDTLRGVSMEDFQQQANLSQKESKKVYCFLRNYFNSMM